MAIGRPEAPLAVTPAQREVLEPSARRSTTAQAQALKARMALLGEEGVTNTEAGRRLGVGGAHGGGMAPVLHRPAAAAGAEPARVAPAVPAAQRAWLAARVLPVANAGANLVRVRITGSFTGA